MTATMRMAFNKSQLSKLSGNHSLAKMSTDSCGVYDLIVIGGGIVGCATAREMKCRHPELRIAIVEKENALAKHQTGHNSGVIHAGIYYKPGSIKAKLCVEGLKLSYDYLCEKNICHKKIGKLIVAQDCDQVRQLHELYERGLQNNCPEIKLVEKDCLSNYEPNCKGEKAIWSPWTGIVDWGLVCKHFAEDFEKMGGDIFLNFEASGFAETIESKGNSDLAPICVYSKQNQVSMKFMTYITVPPDYLNAKYILTCAGLHSDRLAVMTGCGLSPRIVPFRGEYLLLKEDKRCLVSTNIYPVPDPRFPFLGVHFTPRVNGDVWLGPNAVLALAREGYSWRDINVRDCIEMAKFPGLYKLCFKYIVPGLNEAVKSMFYQLSVKECTKFIPGITPKDVQRGPSGVRAQAVDNDGNLVDDFVFDSGFGSLGQRILHCRNAPSPGATSSMAIAKFISDKLKTDFKF